jgi:hypothetical protein
MRLPGDLQVKHTNLVRTRSFAFNLATTRPINDRICFDLMMQIAFVTDRTVLEENEDENMHQLGLGDEKLLRISSVCVAK